MKAALFFLLVFICYGAAAQPQERWYKVMYSSNGIWDSSANIFITEIAGTDSIRFLGFTNHGAKVTGVIKDGHIEIPRQVVTIMQSWGSFTSIAEASGSITDSLLVLAFYYKPDTFGHTPGQLRAIRWSKKIEEANIQYKRQLENAIHAANTRDTVIDGITYRWIVYDSKHTMIEIGQSYEKSIKNGRWLYTDDYGRLDNIHHYVNDTLQGSATSFSYKEYHFGHRLFCMRFYGSKWYVYRIRGTYINGKQVGKWVYDWARYTKKKKQKWKTEAFEIFDQEGTKISKAMTYNNGLPASETFYEKDGKVRWYINYDKKGRVIKEGEKEPAVELGW